MHVITFSSYYPKRYVQRFHRLEELSNLLKKYKYLTFSIVFDIKEILEKLKKKTIK